MREDGIGDTNRSEGPLVTITNLLSVGYEMTTNKIFSGRIQLKTFRNIAAIVLTITLAVGLNGCSDLSPTVTSESNPVGQIQDPNPNVTETPSTATPTATAPAPEPTQSDAAAAPVVAEIPAAPAPVPPAAALAPAPAPAPVEATPVLSGQAWINATQAKYGVYAPAGTRFVFGSMPPAGCAGAYGCTVYKYYADNVPFDIVITLLPGTVSEYILFHEIGHAKGIKGECAADNYARSVIGPLTGIYC